MRLRACLDSPTLRAHLEARLQSNLAGSYDRPTARSKVEVVLTSKGEVGVDLSKALVERDALRYACSTSTVPLQHCLNGCDGRSAARAVEVGAAASQLGPRCEYVARTKSAVQREDHSNATKYALVGQDGLSDELRAVQSEVEELRRQLGL